MLLGLCSHNLLVWHPVGSLVFKSGTILPIRFAVHLNVFLSLIRLFPTCLLELLKTYAK